MSFGKGGGSESVTPQLDKSSYDYREWLRNMGRQQFRAAQGVEPFIGPSAGMEEALAGIRGVSGMANPMLQQYLRLGGGLAGRLGETFDPSKYMDPFRKDVVAGTQAMFDRQREIALSEANKAMTAGGAFGSDPRGQLMKSQVMSDLARQEASVIPQILSQGYSQALGQYNTEQGMGLQGLQSLLAGTQFGTGLDLQRGGALLSGENLLRGLREQQGQNPLFMAQQLMEIANAGMGPTAFGSTAQAGGGNPLAGAFGGALTGLGVGGPVGALVGGGLGLLGGLFG